MTRRSRKGSLAPKESNLSSQVERYQDETEVEEIQICVAWDSDFSDYTISFPQIDTRTGKQQNVYEKVLRISTIPEIAKVAFDFASKHAESSKSVYDLYKKVDEFRRVLPYDLELP